MFEIITVSQFTAVDGKAQYLGTWGVTRRQKKNVGLVDVQKV